MQRGRFNMSKFSINKKLKKEWKLDDGNNESLKFQTRRANIEFAKEMFRPRNMTEIM